MAYKKFLDKKISARQPSNKKYKDKITVEKKNVGSKRNLKKMAEDGEISVSSEGKQNSRKFLPLNSYDLTME